MVGKISAASGPAPSHLATGAPMSVLKKIMVN